MILKIVILILLIEIIAGKPLKPKGWKEGKPWPPKNEKPKSKPKLPMDSVCPKKKEIFKKIQGFKKPHPTKKPPPKKGSKRSFWDPPIPAVKCIPGRTPPVFLGYPDPDSPAYPNNPEYPEYPDIPEYPGFPDYPGRPYRIIRWLLCSLDS